MKDNDNTKFVEKVVEQLRKAAVELEEFQLKAALGKAEAEDKYEEIKKNFNLFIHDSKHKIKAGKEKISDLNTKFDELMIQLALGKAESKEAFKEQKKKLLLTLHEIEVKIKTNKALNRMYALMLIKIEMFKVQLEILDQKFDEGKDNAMLSFENAKKKFNQLVENFKNKYSTKKEETQWEHFQNEISEAFVHFKHAFAKS